MTPIAYIFVFESMVFTVDHADKLEFVAACETELKAQWLGLSLGEQHRVPVKKLNMKTQQLAILEGIGTPEPKN